MQIGAVILAAGSSSRMGGIKKEHQKLSTGATVLESAVYAFLAVSSIDVIVITENTEATSSNFLPLEIFNIKKPKILFVNGGKTRCKSVFNALSALTQYSLDYVLIHDGARPWVSPSLIENIITAVKKHGAVIPVLPVTETPKELSEDNCGLPQRIIKNHLKRLNVGIAQTPQAFKFAQIFHAHQKAALDDEEFTDDAEIWGKYIGQVAVIPGDPENRKITFKEDLI